MSLLTIVTLLFIAVPLDAWLLLTAIVWDTLKGVQKELGFTVAIVKLGLYLYNQGDL